MKDGLGELERFLEERLEPERFKRLAEETLELAPGDLAYPSLSGPEARHLIVKRLTAHDEVPGFVASIARWFVAATYHPDYSARLQWLGDRLTHAPVRVPAARIDRLKRAPAPSSVVVRVGDKLPSTQLLPVPSGAGLPFYIEQLSAAGEKCHPAVAVHELAGWRNGVLPFNDVDVVQGLRAAQPGAQNAPGILFVLPTVSVESATSNGFVTLHQARIPNAIQQGWAGRPVGVLQPCTWPPETQPEAPPESLWQRLQRWVQPEPEPEPQPEKFPQLPRALAAAGRVVDELNNRDDWVGEVLDRLTPVAEKDVLTFARQLKLSATVRETLILMCKSQADTDTFIKELKTQTQGAGA